MSETLPSSSSVSRKRLAAIRLPRIIVGQGSLHASGITDSTDQNSPPTVKQCCPKVESVDLKRLRVSESNQQIGRFNFSDLPGSQSRNSFSSSDGEDVAKVYRAFPDANNAFVCGYQLVGAGKEFNAYNKETDVVKTCQLINDDQYRKILQVRERLNAAEKWSKRQDTEEMKEFLLPADTEIYTDDLGRRFMFSPWQYGTLHSHVQSRKMILSEADIQTLFVQIVKAVAFCHSLGIIVRDLKLRKFVFTDQEMTRLRLHDVFDLFLCDSISNDGIQDRHSCPAYVSPEILTKGPTQYAGKPADIWALGVVLYVLLTGRYPFYDATPQGLFSKILKGKFGIPMQIYLSKPARALIFGMLKREPSERPSAEQLLYNPWICADPSHLSKLPTSLCASAQMIASGSSVSSTFSSLVAAMTSGSRFISSVGVYVPMLQFAENLFSGAVCAGFICDDQAVPTASMNGSSLAKSADRLNGIRSHIISEEPDSLLVTVPRMSFSQQAYDDISDRVGVDSTLGSSQ